MKIRNGFVSNSSSSSFVIIFDRKPESYNDLLNMMFPGCKEDDNLGNYCGENEEYAVSQVVNRVWNDLPVINQEEVITTILEMLDSGNALYNSEISEFVDKVLVNKILELQTVLNDETWDADRSDHQRNMDIENKIHWLKEKVAKIVIKTLKEKNSTKWFALLEYTDTGEGPFGAFMEHGDVFSNVKCVRISHH
jgi:hypothetical protein